MSDEQPTSRRAAREAAAAQASASAPTAAPRGGVMAFVRRNPMPFLLSAIVVVFLLMGTGAVFAGVSVASTTPIAVPTTAAPTTAPPRPTPSASPTASRVRTCSVAGPAADGRLMALTGSVIRSDSGEVLWDRGAATPAETASTMKLLIASAAVSVLGPDFQISTDVVDGSAPGTIVLVGHGDATISALPAGQESVYTGAPKLSDLATQTVANYAAKHPGVPITQVVLDASYWNTADRWTPDVKRSEQTQGYQSETTALQVDGDRANPKAETSARSTDPIGRAGSAFISALQSANSAASAHIVSSAVTTSLGTALPSAANLGEVKSQPLRTLIKQMLLPSDNTLGEMLARIVSKSSGLDGSLASLTQAIPSALQAAWQIPPAGLVIADGSGESPSNKVPPATMTMLLRQIQAGSQNLDVVRDGLSVAGQSGSLASRFTGANAVARGKVAAKTGWVDTEYSLAGTVTAADGTVLEFTFYAIGNNISSTAKAALDTLTTAVYTCGDNLSNN